MMTRFTLLFFVILLASPLVLAQNTNSSQTTPARSRTTNTNTPPKPAATQQPTSTEKPAVSTGSPQTTPKKPVVNTEPASPSEGVLAAFNRLLNGIRHADVDVVMSVYWNSPRLSLFNSNGTVTKGWDQVRANRESSYPEIKDVKLDVKDVSVTMFGTSAALVTCLWTQSQTFKGNPENASGRMTLAFKKIGTAWKAIHLHTSPDSPNPASIPPSEQTPKPSPTPVP
jgi:ketosteroid isomerase-like protein